MKKGAHMMSDVSSSTATDPAFSLPPEYRLKVVFLGEPKAGKTTLMTNLALPTYLSSPLQRLSSFLSNSRRLEMENRPLITDFASAGNFDMSEFYAFLHTKTISRSNGNTPTSTQPHPTTISNDSTPHNSPSSNFAQNTPSTPRPGTTYPSNTQNSPSTNDERKQHKPEAKIETQKKVKNNKVKTEVSAKNEKRKKKKVRDNGFRFQEVARNSKQATAAYSITRERALALGVHLYNVPIKGQEHLTVTACDFDHKVSIFILSISSLFSNV